MRASSPALSAAVAVGLLLCILAPGTRAEPVVITIHAGEGRAMSDGYVARVDRDVRRVEATAAAYEALALPEGIVPATAALAAAREGGLEEGAMPWRVTLAFSWEHGARVWRVTNTTSATPGNRHGRTFTVDASSGRVIARDRWHAIVG